MELLSNRREGPLLPRSPSTPESGAEFLLREPQPPGLSRPYEDYAKRDPPLRRRDDRVSVRVAGDGGRVVEVRLHSGEERGGAGRSVVRLARLAVWPTGFRLCPWT